MKNTGDQFVHGERIGNLRLSLLNLGPKKVSESLKVQGMNEKMNECVYK